MGRTIAYWATTALAASALSGTAAAADLGKIKTIVVIYAENRSFDNLYGSFPGANGLQNVTADQARQLDRDGKPLAELPPAWGGLTAKGVTPAVTETQSAHLPNAPFAIDGAARDRWLLLMTRALDAVALPEDADRLLRAFFRDTAAFLINRDG